MKLAVCTGWTWGWREAAYCVSLVRRLQTLLQFTKTLRCLLSRQSAALDVCRSWEGLAGAEALISIIIDDVTGGRSSGGWPPLCKSPDPSLPCPWVLLESPAYGFLFGKKSSLIRIAKVVWIFSVFYLYLEKYGWFCDQCPKFLDGPDRAWFSWNFSVQRGSLSTPPASLQPCVWLISMAVVGSLRPLPSPIAKNCALLPSLSFYQCLAY